MAIQVSQLSGVVHHTGLLKASVSQLALVVHHEGVLANVRVSQIAATVHHTGPLQPVQIAKAYVVVHRSLAISLVGAILVEPYEDLPPPSITLGLNLTVQPLILNPEVAITGMALDWRVVYPEVAVPEINPYRPTVPDNYEELSPTLYEFQRENQETLRRQHNVSQSGDTTFPWEMLTKVQVEPLFRLGAVGRFYHEDLGIIRGRYVKFSGMNQEVYLNGPAGSLKRLQKNPWIVTNQLSLSHPDAVIGIIASYEWPSEGQYGWLIVGGAPYVVGSVSDGGGLTQGSGYSWSADGQVGGESTGLIFARRTADWGSEILPIGGWKIEFAGLSGADVRSLAGVTQINDDIAALWAAVNALQGNAGGGDSGDWQAAFDALKKQLAFQLNQLASQVAGINGLTAQAVQAMIESAISPINQSQALQDQAIYGLNQQVTSMLSQLAVLAPLPAQVESLLNQLLTLNSAFTAYIAKPPVYRPVVTGSIPPVFMQNPDGTLILDILRPEEYS